MGKLEDADKSFCVSQGLRYIPPDPPISLEEFEAEQHYRNQGPRNPHQMWTPNAGRYLNGQDDKPECNRATSGAERAMILVVTVIIVIITVALAQL